MLVDNGSLYVGGRFSNAGGIPEADGVARWDGSFWHAVGPNAPPSGVDAIGIYNGELHAVGVFGVDRFNGTTWISYPNPGSVQHFTSHGGDLYIGGDFTGPAGTRVSRWNGAAWEPVGA
jgi:hypothetical protein